MELKRPACGFSLTHSPVMSGMEPSECCYVVNGKCQMQSIKDMDKGNDSMIST